MSDHPSTFRGEQAGNEGVDWDDHASIHLATDSGGVLDALKGLHRGTLAEMVAHIASLPESERAKYVIQKAGDHRLGIGEIMALAARADFPGR